MYDVAIICSSIENRRPLLKRSLETWQRSLDHSGLKGIFCVSAEGYNASDLLTDYHSDYHQTDRPSGNCTREFNYWIHTVKAKVYILTGPEVLLPLTAVLAAYSSCKLKRYVNFKMFYIPDHVTAHLEDYPWRTPEVLETINDCYEKVETGLARDYDWNNKLRTMTTWESNATSAMDRATLDLIGSFQEFNIWGMDDPFHSLVRRHLGIETCTLQDPLVFHQEHPRIRDGGWISWDDHSQKILAAFEIWKYKRKHGELK